jgi:hypothetical protein
MVHKSCLIPGVSKFIDENILSHYPATSMKRILMAGAVSLYLKQNEGIVDALLSSPLVTSLGVVKQDGMVDVDLLRDTLRNEINNAGFMRLSIPIVGDIDFTPDDVNALYKFIVESNTQVNTLTTPVTSSSSLLNGGIY